MEYKTMETDPNDGNQTQQKEEVAPAQSSYTIIAYPSSKLPLQYQNVIFSRWLRALKFGNDYFKLIDSDAYYSGYHKCIELLLAQPSSVVRLAVLSDDQDVVLGWSVVRGDTLDFVHVHKDNRNLGIGSALVPANITTITHLTKAGMAIWNKKLPNVAFNPFK